MKRLLLPVGLVFLGPVVGVAAGFAVGPGKPVGNQVAQVNCADPTEEREAVPVGLQEPPGPQPDLEYVKLNNQFIVPVVRGDAVSSMVVMSLSLEMESGNREDVFAREPKLRDALLQELFDHANRGGFEGFFTDSGTLDGLRRALTESARSILGEVVQNVLIMDVARQDI